MKHIFQNINSGKILIFSVTIAIAVFFGVAVYFNIAKEDVGSLGNFLKMSDYEKPASAVVVSDKKNPTCSNEFVHKTLKENNDPFPLLEKLAGNCGDVFHFEDQGSDKINFGITSGHLFDETKIHLLAFTKENESDVELKVYRKENNGLQTILETSFVGYLEGVLKDVSVPLTKLDDVNGDEKDDLQVLTNMGMSLNRSYDIWLYEPKNDSLRQYKGPYLTNPIFDKEYNLLSSCSRDGCAGMCYSCSYYKWEGDNVVLAGKENRVTDKNNNLVVEKYEIKDGKPLLVNENELLLIQQLFKNRLIDAVGENPTNYETGHYTDVTDEKNEINYYIKSLGDLNGDGLEEFVLAEVNNDFEKRFNFYTKNGDVFKFISKEIGVLDGPNDPSALDVKTVWSDLTAQDITGDKKQELIIRLFVTGNNTQVYRILTFDNNKLINMSFEAYFSKKPEIIISFDSISRENPFFVTTWHSIETNGKSYYLVNGNTAFFEKSVGLYVDAVNSDQYEYREIDKDGNIIYKETRQGSIWNGKLDR